VALCLEPKITATLNVSRDVGFRRHCPPHSQPAVQTLDPDVVLVFGAPAHAYGHFLVDVERGQIAVLEARDPALQRLRPPRRQLPLHRRQQQHRRQRAVYDQVAVAFRVARPGAVEMDPVRVPSQRGEAEEVRGGGKEEVAVVRGMGRWRLVRLISFCVFFSVGMDRMDGSEKKKKKKKKKKKRGGGVKGKAVI
jgi:hypothetical protein